MDRKKSTNLKRGDIVYVDFGDTVGSEQNGIRPALCCSNDLGNRLSSTVIVAGITSRIKKMNQPTHIYLGKQFGLTEKSMVMLEQLRTVDQERILRYVGKVDEKTMMRVDKSIQISMGVSSI